MRFTELAAICLYTATVGAAVLASIQLVLRAPATLAYRAAAAFFAALAMIEAANLLALAAPTFPYPVIPISSPLAPTLAPLLWLYVSDLTAETSRRWRPRDLWHFALAALQGVAVLALLTLSPDQQRTLFQSGAATLPIQARLIGLAFFIGMLLWLVQTSVYSGFILVKLFRLHGRLRQVFSSTQSRELTWLIAVTILSLINWLMTLAYNLGIVDGPWMEFAFSAGILLLTLVMATWAVRQAPSFQTDGVGDTRVQGPGEAKYERSLLDETRLELIAGRIATAFDDQGLHLNPLLSLTHLAKATGVSESHISQTFTRRLDTSFFEYVNRRRVRDAMARLTRGDETIMAIAFDVGFNSRSAFYNAFKAETGKTPSRFRTEGA